MTDAKDYGLLILVVAVLIVSVLVFVGYSKPIDGSQRQHRGQNRTSMNFTEEARHQMTQPAIAACSGRAEGTGCAMRGPRGNATGTCKNQNGELMCGIAGTARGNGGQAIHPG